MIGCPICNSSQCREWTTDLFLGRRNLRDAANFFNISPQEVYEHLMKHKVPDAPVEVEEHDLAYYVGELGFLTKSMKDILNTQLQKVIDLSDVRAIMAVMKELRETLKLLAELEGRLQQQKVEINVDVTQQKLDELYEAVVESNMCDRCKMVILNVLEGNEDGLAITEN